MQKTADDMRISDCSSDVCSSDLVARRHHGQKRPPPFGGIDRTAGDVPRAARRLVAPVPAGETFARHGCRQRHAVIDPILDRDEERGLRRTRIERVETEKLRSEEHTSELQSLMRISYAVLCSK